MLPRAVDLWQIHLKSTEKEVLYTSGVWPTIGQPTQLSSIVCLWEIQLPGSGGAIAFRETISRKNTGHTVTIKDCTFFGNSANMGGAFIINNELSNPSKITVLNSTFIANNANGDGGTIAMRGATPDNEFTMVNCTVTENITKGNGGHGAGLLITNQAANPKTNCVKRIYNCIFQGNYAVEQC